MKVKNIEMSLDEFRKLVKDTYEESCFLMGSILYQPSGETDFPKLIGRLKLEFIDEIINCPDIEPFNNHNMHLFFRLKEKNEDGRRETDA